MGEMYNLINLSMSLTVIMVKYLFALIASIFQAQERRQNRQPQYEESPRYNTEPRVTFYLSATEYTCNNTYDIFFLDIPRLFLKTKMIYLRYF